MSESARILVVDDEPMVCMSLTSWLREENYFARAVQDGPSAIQAVEAEAWDIVLLDLKMPGMDGIQVLKRLKEMAPRTVVLMMTAYGSISNSVTAMKEGAYDYLVKPLDIEELSLILKKIVERRQLITQNMLLKQRPAERHTRGNIVGASPAMRKLFDMIRTVADTGTTVLVTGETGTGKELVARAIHSNSSRRYSPFIAVSCGALPETLLESELFGYEKGAFTGADRAKKGRFELAHGGTLFLDEIGEIGMKTQVKLLRVLQERSFNRLGGIHLVEVDVRVITATNRDLAAAVKAGSFRSDLYYRLNVVNIHLPALRDRKEDIPLLAERFMEKFNGEFGKKFDRIEKRAMEFMMDYGWPGNVRELENVIERAVVIDEGPEIKARHLPFCAPARLPCPETEDGEPLSLEEAERRHILKMLDRCDWNVARTARVLAIDRTTLHKKIQRYGLEREKK